HITSLSCHRPRPTESSPLSLHDALPIWICTIAEEFTASPARRSGGSSPGSTPTAAGSICRSPRPRTVASIDRGCFASRPARTARSEEHTSELQSLTHLVFRLLLEKKKAL